MMEQIYTIPENPEYNPEIRQLRDTDPASASEVFNPLFEQLIENTAALKQKADELEANAGNLEEGKGQPGGLATLGQDGKIPSDQLPPMDYDQSGAAEAVQKSLDAHAAKADNPHKVTKAQVGLDRVDNTSDADKPISSAVQTAINAANTAAGNAKATADSALTAANNAQSVANTAQSTANGKASRQILNATLTTNWSGSGPYTQTVTIAGITAAMTPVVGVVLSATTSTAKNQLTAWGCVDRIVTNAGSITATCYNTKPTTAIPIQLMVVQ